MLWQEPGSSLLSGDYNILAHHPVRVSCHMSGASISIKAELSKKNILRKHKIIDKSCFIMRKGTKQKAFVFVCLQKRT
jgi:hypothetical protein